MIVECVIIEDCQLKIHPVLKIHNNDILFYFIFDGGKIEESKLDELSKFIQI